MADAKNIAATLRKLATGTVEWRVQNPTDKGYCIAFDHRSSINPERDAREWLADHKAHHPGSQFAGYEVAAVRWFSELEQAALDAAAALDHDGVATDTPAVCRLCLAVTGGRQCFEPACPGGVAGTDPLGQPGVDDGGPYNGLAAAGAATDGEGSSNA